MTDKVTKTFLNHKTAIDPSTAEFDKDGNLLDQSNTVTGETEACEKRICPMEFPGCPNESCYSLDHTDAEVCENCKDEAVSLGDDK